ncbi:hypothetical protein EDC96DRAFT_573314 [Choanephora cucurbitarum]|nr:hypothetical protein EDC96DRAFT_573314 [Choanephora cucurbitarum]
MYNTNNNNNNNNAENNSQPKKYMGWTNEGCINPETNDWKGTGADNKQSTNGESRSAVLGRIIKLFEENGIHHRTKQQINTRVSQMKARYVKACQWLTQTGQGIRDQIFVMDDAVENEKVQDKTIHDHIRRICPEFNRMDNIWGTSVSVNPPCESSDNDDVEAIMGGQDLREPVEDELVIADTVATQSRKRATNLELLGQLLDRQNERAQKRIKIDEEQLENEKSNTSSMQTIASAFKKMADTMAEDSAAKKELSRLNDQRQAFKELYQEGALTLEQYRNHVFEALGL